MGVPKFFRFISERYPCLSEVVKEYQIPEFDNLYLDMNGIIHNCSHPDDGNAHFRITEEKIFEDIFHYLEVLFRMIKPQKLFFMAIDGVAPRAKMNQQRGRRFRSAKDAEKLEKEAQKKGEVLPTEERFDSNCITPGTEFMARLHEQLKYFVVMKISTDRMWRNCKIILSGHETPGEGEHKIMDYIRYLRSKPGYDPNTRHCLYGLDADLIMLGLCTHEPHFSLLREEVKFGKKANSKRSSVPEDITFFLLHLSLLREYLELEFKDLKCRLEKFKFDIEKIIDDWVLMGFLVGNDFIPHFPNLHINDGALPKLYAAYMDVLIGLDGYINEGGKLNLPRFEKLLQKLSETEKKNFEEIRDDLLYMETKTGRKYNPHYKVSTNPGNNGEDDEQPEKKMDPGLAQLIQGTNEMYLDSDEDSSSRDDDDTSIDEDFTNYKKEYYKNKMEFTHVTSEVMRDQAEGYVRAIQWNLHYYYDGCCSWSWYYPHHYAPYISDVKGFTNLKIEFDLGKPFHPYEQLLAVLPPASKKLLPKAYHDLMTANDSSIKDYYPEDFQTDLNGKKQEWEAVVLVPFIDEKRLLNAMKQCNDKLTDEEKKRNEHGPMLVYSYTPDDLGEYATPGYFPKVESSRANCFPMTIEDIRVPKEQLIKGAYPGAKFDVYYPGFPTMKHLKYTGHLTKAKVKVFEQPSRNENMILTIPPPLYLSNRAPRNLLGQIVYVGWPHLVEAKIQAIVDGEKIYWYTGKDRGYREEVIKGNNSKDIYRQQVQAVTEHNMTRWGIDYQHVQILVQAQLMIGRKYEITPTGRVTLEKQFDRITSNFPVQGIVKEIAVYNPEDAGYKDIDSVFPNGSTCFILANPYYGSMGTILSNSDSRLKIDLTIVPEPDFTPIRQMQQSLRNKYKSLTSVASSLSMSNHLFSRLTGTILIKDPASNSERGVNVGLDLKFNKKNMETPGFTKKIEGTWYYSEEVGKLIWDYGKHFPEVIDYLSANPSADELNPDCIFDEDSETKVKELRNWIKTLPTHNVERRICGSDELDVELVKNVEQLMDNFYTTVQTQKLVVQIKPQFLFNPDLQTGNIMPDPTAQMRVMDRVVNVREGFTVPLGLKGTIIGIHKAKTDNEADIIYDVVFDKPFAGGLLLNCSDKRGYRMPRTAFINISHGQRLFNDKIGKPTIDTTKHRYAQNRQYTIPKIQERSDNNQQSTAQHSSAFASFGSNYSKVPTLYSELKRLNNPDTERPGKSTSDKQSPTQGNKSGKKTSKQQSKNCFMPTFDKKSSSTSKDKSSRPKANPVELDVTIPQDSQPPLEYILETQVSKSSRQSQLKIEHNRSKAQESNANVDSKKYIAEQVAKRNSAQGAGAKKPDSLLESTPQGGELAGGSNTESKTRSDDILPEESTTAATTSDDNFERLPKIPDQSAQAKIDTEYLKKLLKIANPPQKGPAKSNLYEPGVSYAIRLLNYYQAKGYGLPRFHYISLGSLKMAQITLPNNKMVVGLAGKNDEEASENASKAALDVLVSEATPVGKDRGRGAINKTPTFPDPPQTWVEHPTKTPNQKVKNQSKANNQANRSPSKQQPSASRKNASKNLNIASSFVPLQVIKNAKTGPALGQKALVFDKSPMTKSDQHTEHPPSTECHQTDKKKQDNKGKAERRRPERKHRLAANFSVQPQ